MRVKNILSSVTLFLVLLFVSTITNNKILNSYAQTLSKSYASQNCNISVNYPSSWKFEERTDDDPATVINNIVELQPNNDEGFNNVVGIELDDISSVPDKSVEGIKQYYEDDGCMHNGHLFIAGRKVYD
jgi:hypothetical protein